MANERKVIEETTTTTTTKKYIQERQDTPQQNPIASIENAFFNGLKTITYCVAGALVLLVLIMQSQPRVTVTNNGGNNSIYLNR